MMALSVLVVTTLRLWLDRAAARAGRLSRAVVAGATVLLIVVLVALAARTVFRNSEYSDRVSLWRSVVDRRPHGRARFSYASALLAAGNHQEALAQLREAARDYEGARYALGVELIFAGEVEDGIAALREFIRGGPSDRDRIPARTLLARSLASKGDLDGAEEQARAILEALPSNVEARVQLAEILRSQRRFDEAIAEFLTVAERVRSPAIETGLAITLMEGGRLEEAIEHFELAAKLAPESAAAHRGLAQVNLQTNRLKEAVSHAREAVRLDPRSSAGHNLLGAALASEGELDEAIEHFRLALQIEPDDQQTRDNLARALSLRSRRPPGEGSIR